MNDFTANIDKLVEITSDYRVADGISQSRENVSAWLEQFPENIRLELLTSVTDCLGRTYFSKKKFVEFLDMLCTNSKFCGDNAKEFWSGVNLLNIQISGNSQREMVSALKSRIQKNLGLNSGDGEKVYIYFDDAIFSGGRAKNDLVPWIKNHAPPKSELRIVTVGLHSYGHYVVDKAVEEAVKESGKDINFRFWRAVEFKNNPRRPEISDVLWPAEVPDDELVKNYISNLPRPELLKLRNAQLTKPTTVFPNIKQREFLERELLIAGARVREICPQLTEFQRPLGNILFSSFGFGSLFVTFRNCANNVPIALWAGSPWIPLFPRKTNTDSSFERFMESL